MAIAIQIDTTLQHPETRAWRGFLRFGPQFNRTAVVENVGERRDILSPEIPRLFRSIAPVDGVPRVWFPNGSTMAHLTIRMGLRDYGTASAGIYMCFKQLKQWERQTFAEGELRSREGFEKIAEILLRDEAQSAPGEGPPRSWVTDFIYRPLVFAGVGLSEQEVGLWWLLRQKARNVARVPWAPAQVRVLTNVNRAEFGAANPFGITQCLCSNWDEGWGDVPASVEIVK